MKAIRGKAAADGRVPEARNSRRHQPSARRGGTSERLSDRGAILALVDDLAVLAAELYFEGLLDGFETAEEEAADDQEV